ncbi:hypothetical protein EVAR_32317_1 [Eumeta japonica]|uniref:Uncharacterized protein n=1 Tax=Eumeta variegata TaxID=151549 RepID=A0A4C1Z795_EUMVA|nr:hypothetical protein EVAR_32317_1 [Eumeta japonica]
MINLIQNTTPHRVADDDRNKRLAFGHVNEPVGSFSFDGLRIFARACGGVPLNRNLIFTKLLERRCACARLTRPACASRREVIGPFQGRCSYSLGSARINSGDYFRRTPSRGPARTLRRARYY